MSEPVSGALVSWLLSRAALLEPLGLSCGSSGSGSILGVLDTCVAPHYVGFGRDS